MLYSRRYKNNYGFQITVERPDTIHQYMMTRANDNKYYDDGYNKYLFMGTPSNARIQKGGQNNDAIPRQPYDNTINQTLNMLYEDMKTTTDKSDILEDKTQQELLRNTYGEFINPNETTKSGFAGEEPYNDKEGVDYNFLGKNINIKERLLRGDIPINELDSAAKSYLTEYNNADTFKKIDIAKDNFVKNVNKLNIDKPSKDIVIKQVDTLQDKLPEKIVDKLPNVNISGRGNNKRYKDPARKLKNKIKRYRNKKRYNKMLNIAFKSIKKRLDK